MKVNIVKPEEKIKVDIEKDIEVNVKPTISVEIVNSKKQSLNFSLNMRSLVIAFLN